MAPPAANASASSSAPEYHLYVRAGSPISSKAIVDVRRFLARKGPAAHPLRVLDIARHRDEARADAVRASPTLVRCWPLPARRVLGDLSDAARIEAALGLPVPGAPPRG